MSATISNCGMYRYDLTRSGDLLSSDNKLLFIMLNPSTADHETDDSTIIRCTSFAKSFGFNGFSVGNLYALRATDPSELWISKDPIGPENNAYLEKLALQADTIICAWGGDAEVSRALEVCDLLRQHAHKFKCLVVNKSGHPRHPLYVKGSQSLIAWTPDLIETLG